MPPAERYLKKYNVDTRYNLKVLWGYLRSSKWIILIMLILIVLIELASIFDTFVFKFLVDEGTDFVQGLITKEDFMNFLFLILGIFVLVRIIGSSAMWFVRVKLLNRIEGKVLNNLEKDSFWHVINLSYRYHLNKKTGSMISQLTRGVSKTEGLLDSFIFDFIPTTIRVILSLGVIVYFDLVTAIILLIMVFSFITVGVIITHKQKKDQNIANYREDILKQNVADVFTNIETVKYFAKENRTQSYFARLSKILKESRIKFWDWTSWYISLQTIIIDLGILFIIYFSFIGFIEGRITLGSITLIYASIWKLLPRLFGLMHGYRRFIRNNVDVSALFETFKEKNEILDIPDAKDIKVDKGEIKFDHVYFTYPKSKDVSSRVKLSTVLKNFNLNVKKNTRVALVGPSGGGKTTVIKLLYRLFDLNEGKISIDGQDICKVKKSTLRDSMSVVPQEPILFDNTIYFNVAYAKPNATKKEVWKAIKFAQLDKLIKNLPFKEKTIVGERGIKLSGGEKQRVSIARAILANKKILILDEATSALDSETEREIQKDLEKLMKGRTTLMIAHRLSTIMKADVIVVVQRGKIVEMGSHKELTNKKGGLYKKLWSLQQGGRL